MRFLRAGFLIAALCVAVQAQFVDATRLNIAPMTHKEWATQVLSTPSAKEIISAGLDGKIVFWDAATGKQLREIALPNYVLGLAISKDGALMAAGDSTGVVSLVDVATAKVKGSFRADKTIANAVAWSTDGQVIAAGGGEGIVRLWSANSQQASGEINPAHGDITSLAFADSQLVIGLRDTKEPKRRAEVWDWQSKKVVRTFDEGAAGLRAIALSPDKKLVALGDFEKATRLSMLPGDGDSFEMSLRVLPESDSGTDVAIWDLSSGKRAGLVHSETGARSISFSPDGTMLACAGPNGAMLFEVGSYAEIGRIDSVTSIDGIAFGPDSRILLVAHEREGLVQTGQGGVDKLVDPFFTSLIMQLRDGINSGATINLGSKTGVSVTNGSAIEAWQLTRRTSPQDSKTFEAVKANFSGKTAEALAILKGVIKDYPNYGEAQRLSAVFGDNKDLKTMQGLLEAAVAADPNCSACWRSLGDFQYGQKQSKAALQSYARALKLKPEFGLVIAHQADAYRAMAFDLINAGNTRDNLLGAEEALNHAIKLRPAESQFFTDLSTVYYFEGDFDGSIQLLLTAQRLKPEDARIYYNLGHDYRQKGDKKRAIEAYQRYVKMGEPGQEARVEKAKQYIQELSK